MSATFSEKKLELEYYDLWKQHFLKNFKAATIETFIPGKEEVHVGFDLGFSAQKSKFKFTADDFFEWIKERVQNPSHKESILLFAYFYQYKLVEEVAKLSRIKDKHLLGYLAKNCNFKEEQPAYRAKLDIKPKPYDKGKKIRPYGQHEALVRLSKVPNASVAYCTPKFIKSDGYPSRKHIDDLCLTKVDISSKIPNDGKTHHLYFSDKLGTLRYWCSDPIKASRLNMEYSREDLMTPKDLFLLLKFNFLSIENSDLNFESIEINQSDFQRERFMQYFNALPSCTRLMVVNI
ncbi:hypothetical protein [Janthinobacterium kumbetense]|uniref:Uncharacterized protein n=1 Tax=Janthinobacterium kumbetense TaxID=2950280 RepID=A0ABT0WNS6_9BURK|nr:hypothetical protein [Janthinobacterium kumbetense]MCM2564949.1 hypothetical protein [Janthinobacterium kumbetense]